MCAEDIAKEDLVDCHTCYRCDKNFCEACCDGGLDGFPNDRISVSSIYFNNHDDYEASDMYIYCQPKCRALHHWHIAARRYTEAVRWRTYEHELATLKLYTLSIQRQETHPVWNLLWQNFEALLEPHVIPPTLPTNTPALPSLRGCAAVIAARVAAAAVTNTSHIVASKALSHFFSRA